MEDVPQPAPEPYEPGDEVKVYLDEDDHDSSYHDTRAVVTDRIEDGLATHTERPLDSYTYRLRHADSTDPIPVDFRHRDLVPLED